MNRPDHSAKRDRAWGRFFAQRGAVAVLAAERPLTQPERLARWFARYVHVPAEMRLPQRPHMEKTHREH
jgi:hypothetical protein